MPETATPTTAVKTDAFAYLAENARAIADLGDAIFWFAEPSLEEHETSRLMTTILEEHGFRVERGLSGFPTAFRATYGSGSPVVALHTEFDANPGNSQVPGAAERREIVPGAPGHCEGHNVNAAVMVASALAIAKAMQRHGLAGTLEVFGTPAEELVLPRPYFVRDGHFDHVDVAFHDHISGRFKTDWGQIQIAAISAEFTFSGETAHAAVEPWRGRDALDAVVLMDMGLAQLREHLKPTARLHRTITHGGEQPNVTPALAKVWWYFRDVHADDASRLFERAKRIAEGAALMTETSWEVEVKSAVWPVRANRTLAEVIQANIDAAGMPAWDEQEQEFARALQRAGGKEEAGLEAAPCPLDGPAELVIASNDCGDVSWKVPMGRLWFPSNVPNCSFHHWTGGAALATSIAHKGALAGAKALAGAALDVFLDPSIAEEAKRTHAEETAGRPYVPMLPADQQPPLGTNAELMERYRPLLAEHHRPGRPRFS